MRRGRLVMAILGLMMMVGAAQAAKVLVVFNPWYNVPEMKNVTPQLWGGVVNWTKDASPSNQFVPLGNNWFAFNFANETPGGFTVLNRSFPEGVERWREYKSLGYDTGYAGV
ncbi:MAG: hypothetical protein AAB214_13100, partial [Fibrobacterota bacterium]